MSMTRPDVKLIMVTAENNNKYYNMHDNGNGTFTVTYGRVDVSAVEKTYSMNDWDKKYREKTGKGYKDISGNTTVMKGYKPEDDPEIEDLLKHLLSISRQYVANKTDIGALNPTAIAQVQQYINDLTSIKSTYTGNDAFKDWCKKYSRSTDSTSQTAFAKECADKFNRKLLELYTMIPRKIANVREKLYHPYGLPDADALNKYISEEQSLLDNIQIQSKAANNATGTNTISEVFGFNFIKATKAEFDFVKNKINSESDSGNFNVKNVYKVANPARNEEFEEYLQNNNLTEDDKNVKLYWHGTGPENVLSIMANGLIIRPANAAYCGSAFGDGIYSAPSPNKSWNYTRQDYDRGSRWMFVNAVITGKSFVCEDNYDRIGGIKICDLDGNKFSQLNLGYHSVHAQASNRSYIRRDEVIVYNKAQVACRYLVELKG